MSSVSKVFRCAVHGPNASVWFDIIAHRSESESERLIEPNFYTANSPTVAPHGVHHELEIATPPVWEHPNSTFIHYHKVLGTDRRFICWSGSLPTLGDASKVIAVWCVGTVFTMLTGGRTSRRRSSALRARSLSV